MARRRRVPWLAAVLVVAAALLGCTDDPLVRTELTVEGMHCDGCEEAVTAELIAIEGVVDVEADWEHGVVVARHHESAAPTSTLVESIESLGYTVLSTTTAPAGA